MTEGYNPFPGFLRVDSTCDLQNTDTSGLEDGCLAHVEGTERYYRLSFRVPAPPVTGVNVLSTYNGPAALDDMGALCSKQAHSHDPSGIGRWIRTNIVDAPEIDENPVSIIFKPNAPPTDVRYAHTWQEVMDLIALSASPIDVWIDCVTSGPFSIPLGVYDMKLATLRSVVFSNPSMNLLIAPEGVQLRNLSSIVGSMGIEGRPSSLATFAFDIPNPGEPPVLVLQLGAALSNRGSRSLIDAPNTGGGPGMIFALYNASAVDDGSTAPIISIAPNGVAILSLLSPGGSPANIVSGDATTQLWIIGTSSPVTPPTVGFTGTLMNLPGGISFGGPTAQRPSLAGGQNIGLSYFDTSLGLHGKPIWWNGTAWVYADGTLV